MVLKTSKGLDSSNNIDSSINITARALNSTAISKYVTLKMTDVPSKHVWKIKESCYVYTTTKNFQCRLEMFTNVHVKAFFCRAVQ